MNTKFSLEEAKKLPVGTVLIDASTANRKEENQVHCIVTEEGINYFQYVWFKKKFEFDPASYGVGISAESYPNTQFIKLPIPAIDIHATNKSKLKM